MKERSDKPEDLDALREQIIGLGERSIRKSYYPKLRQSEEQYRAIFELASIGMGQVDPRNGQLLCVNDRFCEITGYNREELLSTTVLNLTHPDDREADWEKYTRMLRDETPEYSNEKRYIRKGGTVIWVYAAARAIRNAAGKPVSSVGILMDITERKTIEAELRESERKFRDLTERSLVGVYVIQNGVFKYINPRFSEIFGYTVEELVNSKYSDLILLDDRPFVEECIRKRIAGQDEHGHYTFRGRTKDGKTIHVEVFSSRTIYEGEPAIIGTLLDVTERHRAEEELAESRNYLDKIINSVADPIFVKDRQHRWVLLNDAFCNFMGYKREDLLGRSDYDFLPKNEADVFWSQDEIVFTTKEENVNEEVCTDAKGIVHTVVTRKTLYTDDKGEECIVGIIHDITVRKKIESELIKAQKLESVGLLAGGIAHDFNNILTAILGNISLSKILLSPQDKTYDRLIDAEMASLRAKDLAQQLLTFAEGGAPVRKPISAAEVVQHSARLALSGTRATCEFAIPNDLWFVEADEGQISQVIHNLIINADQAMPNGGPITVVCENIHLEDSESPPLKSGKYVKIVIKDRGTGILEKDLGKIFDPYFSTKKAGRGLGLASVYSILKNHGGHITVESKVAAGTTFTIYLPSSGAPFATCRQKESGVISGTGRILVMDDEEVVRKVATAILKHIGYEVESAEDGAEAVEMYKQALESRRPFDAVIMDLTIPGGMGGKEAIKELIKIDPKVRAIVSSGYSNDPIMSNFKEYGFAGTIMKPYQIAELSEHISNVIKDTNQR